MKLITFTVPCYNSAQYLNKCIDSLLVGGDDVEIVIVNDGSTDGTLAIADEYAKKYPDIVRVVDKENGGHGSGVNAGIKAATGVYFKVVDSDDWLDADALKELLAVLKRNTENGVEPDLYVTNFIYDHVEDGTFYVSRFNEHLPVNVLCGWESAKKFRMSKMLLMHALMYKLSVLKEAGLVLPEHTFYVDNIFAYQPLPYVKTLFYVDADLYHYFIGRADQSVNIDVFVERYEQQLRVTHDMIEYYDLDTLKKLPDGLYDYMIHSLFVMVVNSSFFCGAKVSKERKAALKAMWDHIKAFDKNLYKKLRYRSYLPWVYLLPWRPRAVFMRKAYKTLCKKIKLG